MLFYAMWGVSIEGEEKNDWRELPQRSPRYEIGLFSCRSPFPLNKKITKISGDRESKSATFTEVAQKKTLHLSAGGSLAIYSGACTVSTPPRARACVCVYKCLDECHKRGKKEDKAKEGGMVDNSGSSKAQMVSPGPSWRPSSFI